MATLAQRETGKVQDDKVLLISNLDIAYTEREAVCDALYASQRGPFDTWYVADRIFGLNATLKIIDKTRTEAAKDISHGFHD